MNPEGVLLTPTPVWRWLGFEDLAIKSEEYDRPHSIVSSVFFCMIGKEKTLWKSYISGSQPQCILLFCSWVTKFGWVASASSMSLCRDTGVTEMRFSVLVFNLCEIKVCQNQTMIFTWRTLQEWFSCFHCFWPFKNFLPVFLFELLQRLLLLPFTWFPFQWRWSWIFLNCIFTPITFWFWGSRGQNWKHWVL